ncbi:MAG: hypothetical protein H0V89_01665 [Deltaproteobacteria bacterium]|nr:hypothetical protein [Deltaproteobacteria bacterium]
MRWVLVCAAMGCGKEASSDAEPGPDLDGACGDVGNAVVQVLGSLELSDGTPAAGASVRLEERNWNFPEVIVYAEGTTDAAGDFDLGADIVTVAECWGTAVGYYVVGELGGATGERGVNSWLFTAVEGTGGGVATIDQAIALVEATGGT